MIKWPGLYMPPINLWNVPRLENEMSDWSGTPEQEIESLREMVEQRDERIAELEQCLQEARANMEDWGSYVDEYFRDKHGIAEDLAAIDRVLGGGNE